MRPVGIVLELQATEPRVEALLAIPAGCPGREQQVGHQAFDTSKPNVVLLSQLERLFRGLALVGVRVEHHPADAGGVGAAGRLTDQLGLRLELVPAPLSVAGRGLRAVPQLVNGAVQSTLPTLIGEVDAEQEHLTITQVDVRRRGRKVRVLETPVALVIELVDALELLPGRDVPRGLVFLVGGSELITQLALEGVVQLGSHDEALFCRCLSILCTMQAWSHVS